MSEIRPAAPGAALEGAVTAPDPAGDGPPPEGPASAVLSAAATAVPAYTASAAQNAATALIRMFVEQGVFGPFPTAPEDGPEPEPLAPPAPDAPRATDWERARSAVDRAEARRGAVAGPVADGPELPVVPSLRLVGEIVRRASRNPDPVLEDAG
ncbi:hypothetical protein [Streptomyces sp. NPDC097619]|uniref:hypothetical protein n=1 Tax=Streptomyces sp. NPDC097619 TaxID=3157228 RepID=UPI00331BD462